MWFDEDINLVIETDPFINVSGDTSFSQVSTVEINNNNQPIYIQIPEYFAPVQSVNGKIGFVTITQADLGISGAIVVSGDLINYATNIDLSNTGSNLQNQINNLDNIYVTQNSGSFINRPTLNGTGFILSGESELGTFAKNSDNNIIYKGQPVYIEGANGKYPLIKLASSSGERLSSKTIGLATQDINVDNYGYIISNGILENFNTLNSLEGDPMWLGPTGSIIYGTGNKPSYPNHLVFLGTVLKSDINGSAYISIRDGYEIGELHNVSINNPQNNQVLFYNSSNNAWINKQISTGDIAGMSEYALTSVLISTRSNLQNQINSIEQNYVKPIVEYYNATGQTINITSSRSKYILIYNTGIQTSIFRLPTGLINSGDKINFQTLIGTSGTSTIQQWNGSTWGTIFSTSKPNTSRAYIAQNNQSSGNWLREIPSSHSDQHAENGSDPITIKTNQISDINSFYYPTTNPSGYITGVDLSNYYPITNPSGYISSSGDNIISGDNTFYGDEVLYNFVDVKFKDSNVLVSGGKLICTARPLVNGSGVLLQGEIDNIVYTTGNQSINGIKTIEDLLNFGYYGSFDFNSPVGSVKLRLPYSAGNRGEFFPVFLNNPTFNSQQFYFRTREELRSDIEAPLSGDTVLRRNINQNISGTKTFVGPRLNVSGTDSTSLFIRSGKVFINVNGPSLNTPSNLEIYESGNVYANLKINNPHTGLASRAGITLASPGNQIDLFTIPNSGSYHCYLSGSQFTEYHIQNNNIDRMIIGNDGKVLIGPTTPNNLGGILQLDGGITFPAVQNTSSNPNTLDDYEEGTWTPTLQGETSGGTFIYAGGITRNGTYTKIGNLVFIRCRFFASSISGTSTPLGNLQISNLPFPVATGLNQETPISIPFFSNVNTPVFNLFGMIGASNPARIALWKQTGANSLGGASRLTVTDISGPTGIDRTSPTGLQLAFSATYIAQN